MKMTFKAKSKEPDRLLLKDVSLTQHEDYWLHEAFSEHALKRGFSMVH